MKLTVIGGGNMGGAIALGAINQGVVAASFVTISHLSDKMRPAFGTLVDSMTLQDCNAEAIQGADMVVLAVKPWLVEEVLREIAPALDRSRCSIISVVAGVSFEELSAMLECATRGSVPLYRVIPNTAISIGCGVSVISQYGATPEGERVVVELFEALGSTFVVEESMMTPFTSLASCGIAFALRYIDASKRGGECVGIDPEVALEVTIQTMQGALEMLRHNASQPQTEIDKVTTKGGLTFRGLDAMEREGFSHAVICGIKESR